MIVQILLVIAGLAVLLVAGDMLVRGAVGLAQALRIPALLVGLTVVAFGTSAPELFVSVQAVLTGNAGIAIGNIVGSNIANTFLVLGIPALVYPIATNINGLRRHAATMLVATAAFSAIAYVHGRIDMIAGVALLACIIAYIVYTGLRARTGAVDEPLIEDVASYHPGEPLSATTIGFIAGGLVGLPLGGHLLVTNAAALAAGLGMRPEIIGLTVVAFGTSLPELATVLAAAFHKKSDVAIGNVVGSNIFNIFAVGGATGIAGVATFSQATLQLDLPVMIVAAIVTAGFVFMRRNIGRLSGIAMTLAYLGFVAALSVSTA